jgi:hypothetical protein
LLGRFMLGALRSGDRLAISAAASLEASQLATRGGPSESAREATLVRLSEKLGEGIPLPERPAQALRAMFAMRCFLRGRWKEAFEAHENAYATLPASRGIWNAHALAVYAEFALGFLGEPAELARRLPALLTDAERRGDRLKVVNLRTGVAPLVYLAKDDPDGARQQVVVSIAQWSQRGFLIQHWRAMIAEVDIYLYEERGPLAHERLTRHARAFRRSMLGLAQYVRAVNAFARARSAVGSARDGGGPARERLREAAKIGRRLEREATPWIGVLASMALASVANAEGRLEEARSHLRKAMERAHATDMALHEEAARYRLGTLLADDQGRELVLQAKNAMRAKGVHAPERYTAMLLPGRWGTGDPFATPAAVT